MSYLDTLIKKVKVFLDIELVDKKKYLGILILILILFICINIISPIIPVTSDEAWNYLRFARFGPIYSITNYDAANFHIFFTFVQSLTVPSFLLSIFPSAIRLSNTFIEVFFFAFMFIIVSKYFHKKFLLWLFLIVSCLFVSPVVTQYFIVGRGYLLGAVLLILGIYLFSEKKFYLASLAFILSGWTVPTFIYTIPVTYLFAFMLYPTENRKKILYSGLITILGIFICYIPLLGEILFLTNTYSNNSMREFLFQTYLSFSNFSFFNLGAVLNIIFIVSYGLSLFLMYVEKKQSELKRFVILLLAAIISYFLCIVMLSTFKHVNEPFIRNGVFIPIIMAITIWIAFSATKKSSLKFFLLSILVLNILAGFSLFIENFPESQHFSYPFFVGDNYSSIASLLTKIKERKSVVLQPGQENNAIVEYYLFIYHAPFKQINKQFQPQNNLKSQPQTNSSTVSRKLNIVPSSISIHPKKESSPSILPTSRMYVLKRIWQIINLKLLDIFDYQKKSSINYLLALSDTTYSEADILWQKGNYNLALKTALRAENYMTVLASDTHTYVLRSGKNKNLFLDIEESVLLHQSILRRMIKAEDNKNNSVLSDIIFFLNTNYRSVQVLIDK